MVCIHDKAYPQVTYTALCTLSPFSEQTYLLKLIYHIVWNLGNRSFVILFHLYDVLASHIVLTPPSCHGAVA